MNARNGKIRRELIYFSAGKRLGQKNGWPKTWPHLLPAARAIAGMLAVVAGVTLLGCESSNSPPQITPEARKQMVINYQIPQAMREFKAANKRAPKDNDEFMEKIIKAHIIQLPELPPGERYIYDPKTEQLTVESSKPK